MKIQLPKLCLLLFGASVMFTGCVKSDDLAGMEDLQTATIKNKLSDANLTDIEKQRAIAGKVYDMQTEVSGLKASILGLQADSNQIKFLIVDYKAQITADSASSVANKEVIDRLTTTGTDYNTKINTLYDDAAADFKTLENAKLAYDNALNAYNVAGAKSTNSATAYSAVLAQKTAAAADTATALTGYPSRDALTLVINKSNTRLVDYNAVMLQFKATTDALLVPFKTASADRDLKYSKVLEAQAVVDNDALNGITSTAHNDALTLANTNYGIANVEYNKAKGNYDAAAADLANALDDLTSEQTSNAALVKKGVDYDFAKGNYSVAVGKLPALLTAKNADLLAYNTLLAPKDAASTAKTIAQANYTAKDAALTVLKTDKKTLTDAIAAIMVAENTVQKSLKKNSDILVQLTTAGYNTNTKQIVKDWITATQEKIKALELVIASYKA